MTVEGVSEEPTIPEAKYEEWLTRFGVYRQPPTKADLKAWLERFAPNHLALASKLLDAVIIKSELEIQECYRASLQAIPGWSRSHRTGRWFFVGAGDAGESGQAMLRVFREANNLTHERWQTLFVSLRQLPSLRLSALDTLVFVDDFAGSGKQMCDYWPTMQELIASEAKCYLLLTAATSKAAAKIAKETELILRFCLELGPHDDVFNAASTLLSDEEREALLAYGEIAWPGNPKGFREGGLLLVLSHKTPNNSVPVLHANHASWKGLFPRNLLPA